MKGLYGLLLSVIRRLREMIKLTRSKPKTPAEPSIDGIMQENATIMLKNASLEMQLKQLQQENALILKELVQLQLGGGGN